MLARELRVKKRQDFDSVYKKGKSYSCKYLKVYVLSTDLPIQRFGFSISKKVSKRAVDRNKLKRQISFIIREELHSLKSNIDLVFVLRSSILDLPFAEMKSNINNLLEKANLYKQVTKT